MNKEELSYAEILQIIELFKSSSELSEFRLKYGITEIDLRKPGSAGTPSCEGWERQNLATSVVGPPPKAQVISAPTEMPAAIARPESAVSSFKTVPIKSMTVGTFYCAPEPGAVPFVKVGQRVAPDTTVCIVEVMKLMNAIQAECSGIVSEILVKDGEPVEFGQTLMVVDQD
jgi:acetyl-CoA carboxylase biotin carboxyl carrier protein